MIAFNTTCFYQQISETFFLRNLDNYRPGSGEFRPGPGEPPGPGPGPGPNQVQVCTSKE